MPNDRLNSAGQYRHRPDLNRHVPFIDRRFAEVFNESQQFSGTVSGTGATFNLNGPSNEVTIQVPSGIVDLLASFDGGVTFVTILATTTQTFKVRTHSIFLKGSGGTATFEIVVSIGNREGA